MYNAKPTSVGYIANTFLPRCRNKAFSVDMLVYMIFRGFCKLDDMPGDVRKKVRAEMNKRYDYCNANNISSFPF